MVKILLKSDQKSNIYITGFKWQCMLRMITSFHFDLHGFVPGVYKQSMSKQFQT